LDSTEETKPNTTKANIHPENESTTQNKHKKTKARFGRLARPPGSGLETDLAIYYSSQDLHGA